MGVDASIRTRPGTQSALTPTPDCGENTYLGSGRLSGKKAVITGGDSGIGRAVAIAYAREGADVLISYLDEHEDAAEVAELVRAEGRVSITVPGDLSDPAHCRAVVAMAVEVFGRIDILVSNAALQLSHDHINEIKDGEWTTPFV